MIPGPYPSALSFGAEIIAFRQVMESMQTGITITDFAGTILYTNPAEAGMHGYEVSDLIGRSIDLFSIPRNRKPLTRHDAKFLKSWKRESLNTRKDGSTFAVQLLSDVVRDPGGEPFAIVTVCEDISERKRKEDELRESERRFRSLAEGTTVMIWMNINNENIFTHRWLNLKEGIAENWVEQIHREDIGACLDTYITALREKRSFIMEYRLVREDGYRWILDHGTPWFLPDGSFAGFVGSCIDITERKKLENQWKHDAFHDSLTGLPNRALFLDRLETEIRRGMRKGRCSFALLFLDLDSFKNINDRYGHAGGDQLLVQTAKKLEQCLRPGDTVARIGGDEFTLLLEGIQDVSDASRIAVRIQEKITEGFSLEGQPVALGASVGIAFNPVGYPDADSVLREADTAMYRAKLLGGNRYEIFDQVMHAASQERLHLELDLSQALARGEFAVHYQPVVNLQSGETREFEALLRWFHPTRGMLHPANFLEIAAATGILIPLERWAFYTVCKNLAAWKNSGMDPLPKISINLSGAQMGTRDWLTEFMKYLNDNGLDPGMISIEISESDLQGCASDSVCILQKMRSMGMQLHVDHFGKSSSQIQSLLTCPVDAIKIDSGVFASNGAAGPLLKVVTAIAKSIGIPSVALGVETSSQMELSRSLDYAGGQGYLFSQALPPNEIPDWMERKPLFGTNTKFHN